MSSPRKIFTKKLIYSATHSGTFPSYKCFYPTQTSHQDFITSLPHCLITILLSHSLPFASPKPQIVFNPKNVHKHAFNTDPQCPLASLPPSCHEWKIALLLPYNSTPGPICTPHHLTADARVKRQHLGGAIFDIR